MEIKENVQGLGGDFITLYSSSHKDLAAWAAAALNYFPNHRDWSGKWLSEHTRKKPTITCELVRLKAFQGGNFPTINLSQPGLLCAIWHYNHNKRRKVGKTISHLTNLMTHLCLHSVFFILFWDKPINPFQYILSLNELPPTEEPWSSSNLHRALTSGSISSRAVSSCLSSSADSLLRISSSSRSLYLSRSFL